MPNVLLIHPIINRKKRSQPTLQNKPISITIPVNTMPISVYEEKLYPSSNDMINTNTVDNRAKRTTVRNLEYTNSFLLIPSIRFCFESTITVFIGHHRYYNNS